MLKIDHVALVVRSIETTVTRLEVPADLSAIESFPSEGTRELYLGGPDQPGRLLLMQPTAEGPYARALHKRGEGLHHVALFVDDVHTWVASLACSGWLLHPASLALLASVGQVWLCRPGVGCLIEVSQGTRRYTGTPRIDEVRVPVARGQENLVAALGVQGLVGAVEGGAALRLDGTLRDIDHEQGRG